MLIRLCPRACLVLLALLLACFPTRLALAQEAPPLEADAPARPSAQTAPARHKSPMPVAGTSVAGRPAPSRPSAIAPAAAKAQPAPARPVARGPAVRNDGKRYLRSLDENHDGRISRDEYLARTKKGFAKLDLNGDGVISAQEARAAKAKTLERKAKSDARRLAQGKPVRPKAKADRPAKPYLSSIDANKDGRVARKEYLARREKKFAELDLNRDGVISKEEARAAKAKTLARREERKAEALERQARKKAKAEARAADQSAAAMPVQPPVPEAGSPAARARPATQLEPQAPRNP